MHTFCQRVKISVGIIDGCLRWENQSLSWFEVFPLSSSSWEWKTGLSYTTVRRKRIHFLFNLVTAVPSLTKEFQASRAEC